MLTDSATAGKIMQTMPSQVAAGAAGGLVGGVVFGIMMQAWDMMPMVAMLVDKSTTAVGVGWVVHLAISIILGIGFAVLFGRWAGSLPVSTVLGLGYGLVWWVLGGLILMPARLGMDLFMWNTTTQRSLIGHLVYGLLLGAVYALVRMQLRRSQA